MLVRRAWCAVDVGQVISADGVLNQIEGGIVQTVSWTLKERITYDRETITSRNWDDYPILTFPEVPEMAVEIIDRPDLAEFIAAGFSQRHAEILVQNIARRRRVKQWPKGLA